MLTPRPYQQEAFEAVMAWIKKCTDPCMIEAVTACHEPGHPILMFDGSVKKVEDIRVGDKVMGPDSTPRNVVDVHNGHSKMYRVIPKKGEEFRVNENHVFSCYVTPRKAGQSAGYSEFTAKEFVEQHKFFRHIRKLQHVAVEFSNDHCLEVPPYVVGALLGDGCLVNLMPSFCTMDVEVDEEISRWAESIGCKIGRYEKKGSKAWNANISDPSANRYVENRARVELKKIGIYGHDAGSKHVPEIYKTSSRDERLEILAGLIDTDGYKSRNGFDWISKSERLADDMVFLCRSVGLSAYKAECQKSCQGGFTGTYYRVSVGGDCAMVPCRVPRRMNENIQRRKRVDVTGMEIIEDGHGEYHGFELDGDHLYLDGYFFRHHNSGKSLICAMLVNAVHKASGKKVLCLTPTRELCEQNAEKYRLLGEPCSIFCAGLGEKSVRHSAIFGTPKSVVNAKAKFGSQIAAIVIDECHIALNGSVKEIIDHVREKNPNVRVIGMTATPFTMGNGYIFRHWPDGTSNSDDVCIDPYFHTCVSRITGHQLLDEGYITPLVTSEHEEGYDTSGLKKKSNGMWDEELVRQVFVGRGRKTSAIVADIVERSKDRNGIMIFAATVQHAEEVMECLPPSISALVTGETPKAERERILRETKEKKIRYLVNVSTLTTGVDITHIDVIAVLRATESAGLLMQILGRGLRLDPSKQDCLLLDYASNIENHFPSGDIFAPEIKARRAAIANPMQVSCPLCSHINEFGARKNEEGYNVDQEGYFCDLTGAKIEIEEGTYYPAHYGRRCRGEVLVAGKHQQCSYHWSFKECGECGAQNDVAARYCSGCRAEIIDPNEKLKEVAAKIANDPYRLRIKEVDSIQLRRWPGKDGKPDTLRVDYHIDESPHSVSQWLTPRISGQWFSVTPAIFGKVPSSIDEALVMQHNTPSRIAFRKNSSNRFFNVITVE